MNCGGSCSQPEGLARLSPDTLEKTDRHPCYSYGAHQKYARMHLPVAPGCNISCNYCNRKYDCVNESRPGVTSEVLSPEMARDKFLRVREKIEALSVVGIAGPGDALANWKDTKKTIELIGEAGPDMVFCISTNGLMLPDYASELIGLGVKHITVTMNAIDPEVGAQIYRNVNYRGRKYEGVEGARILLGNQRAGIACLAGNGVAVKVNIVMIEGINDRQIPEIVKEVKQMGAFMTNIMPLIPAPGSALENYPQTSMKELNRMRDICQADLRQMRHCRQCRADAVGLLGEDRSLEFSIAAGHKEAAAGMAGGGRQYRIAVASRYGYLVDEHFGHASEFAVYQGNGEGFQLVEKRRVNRYCTGMEECDSDESGRDRIVESLKDCDAVITMRIGYHARKRLQSGGIESIETCDTVENGLHHAVRVLSDKSADIA